MRAGADADPFFFAADGDMSDIFIFIKQIDELQHIDVGNARYEIDAGFFQPCENLLRSRDASHIANTSKVRWRALRVPRRFALMLPPSRNYLPLCQAR